MRLTYLLIVILLVVSQFNLAWAQSVPGTSASPDDAPAKPVEVTADQSLEWYQDQHVYVARGHAKAVRNDMVVEADLLKAHERDKTRKNPETKNSSDIDRMDAEGHVRITDSRSRTTGDHAIYDIDAHMMVVTGDNLKYETEKQTVTAKDSLEYYEEKKIAVARGNAVYDENSRHVEGDVLTAEFQDTDAENNSLKKVTAEGHVKVVTKSDIVRGNRAVFDAARNIAIITGHVQITRPDGMQLSGDVGEVDFAANQSRLLNAGNGRVRALLPQKGTDKASSGKSINNVVDAQ
jgi:lipopolysaccharide export system protein LptA